MTKKQPQRRTSAQRGLRGTVYQRGRKWAFMIDLGPDTLTGKRKQQAKSGFDTEQAAWDALAEANAQLRTASYVAPARRTVAEFFDEWLTAIKISVKPTTYANYSAYARAYVLPNIGTRQIQDIEPATIMALYRALLISGRTRPNTNQTMYELWQTETAAGRQVRPAELAKLAGVTYSAATNAVRRYRAGRVPASTSAGLSPRAVASVHVMLHRAFRDAVTWRYISTNPVAGAESPRATSRPHSTWTPAQLTEFLRYARGCWPPLRMTMAVSSTVAMSSM